MLLTRKEEVQAIHQEALEAAKLYFKSEAWILEVLQKMDAIRGYLDFDRTSLFAYAVHDLKLSESVALNFINVARKSVQVPELKAEIEAGSFCVSKARKIVSVLTPENQEAWIEKAKTLSYEKLEREVARVAPQAAQPERVKFIAEDRVSLSMSLDEKSLQLIRRVQDLESQRQQKAVSLEETLEVMAQLYLEKQDPIQKAERAAARKAKKATGIKNTRTRDSKSEKQPELINPRTASVVRTVAPSELVGARQFPSQQLPFLSEFVSYSTLLRSTQTPTSSPRRRPPIPAAILHQVRLRDGMRCSHKNPQGERCPQTRWIEVHHRTPVSQGGLHVLSNLTTLCSAHHRPLHDLP